MLLTILGMTDDVAAIVLPIASSILIFIGGGLANILYGKVKKYQEISSSRNVVIKWSELVIKSANEQASALRELSQSILNCKDLQPLAFRFSHNMADKLSDVSAERMTFLFVSNSKCKCNRKDLREKYVFNIVSQYDFLKLIQPEIRMIYDVYNKSCLDIINRWNALMKRTQTDREKINSSNDNMVSMIINEVISSFMDSPNRCIISFPDWNTKLILPLNQAVDRCKSEFPNVVSAQGIYEDAREMMAIYNQWAANIKGYSEVFANNANAIAESINSLSTAISYFVNDTRARLFCI